MGAVGLDKIVVTPLKRITVAGGDVLHALKKTDAEFSEFGEAYFSMVDQGVTKAWKLHKQMTLNLVVPSGNVRFVFVSADLTERREEIIGDTNYARITVPPGIWFGFQGLAAPSSMVLNIANITHDPAEVERMSESEFFQAFNQ